jgi:hypothetical protein
MRIYKELGLDLDVAMDSEQRAASAKSYSALCLSHTFLLGAAGQQEENGPGASAHPPAKELSQNVADGMPTTDTQSSAYRSTAGHARSCSRAPRSSSENGGADRCAEDCASLA